MEKKKRDQAAPKPKATTAQVIGSVRPVGDKIPAKWKKHYQDLVQLRDQVQHRQKGLSQDACEETPSVSLHQADAATDHFDRDLALGMLSSDQSSLYQIEQAIGRIKDGSYGVCEMTGKPIEPERLVAVPWTRFSLAAEQQLENRGERPRTRLGDRAAVGKAEDQEAAGGEDDERE